MENKEGGMLTPITANASGAPFNAGAELDTQQSLVLKWGGSNSILQGSWRTKGTPDGRAGEGSQPGPPTPSHRDSGFVSSGEAGNPSARKKRPTGWRWIRPMRGREPLGTWRPPKG